MFAGDVAAVDHQLPLLADADDAGVEFHIAAPDPDGEGAVATEDLGGDTGDEGAVLLAVEIEATPGVAHEEAAIPRGDEAVATIGRQHVGLRPTAAGLRVAGMKLKARGGLLDPRDGHRRGGTGGVQERALDDGLAVRSRC